MAVVKSYDANSHEWADFALRAATGPRPLMRLIANLRDLAVLAPASLGLIVLLSWICARRDAAAYAAAAVVCLAAALVAKLAFAACSGRYSLFGVESPSGHAAFSVTFYGAVAAPFATRRTIGPRWALYGAVGALLLAIGASRIALEAHTAPEVVAGVLIGAASIALFNALRIQPKPLALSPQTVVQMSPFAVLYAISVLLLADRWSAEPIIDAIAAHLGVGLHLCR